MAFVRRNSHLSEEEASTYLVAWCRHELRQLTRTVDLLESGHLQTKRFCDGGHIDSSTATAEETRQKVYELAFALLQMDVQARAKVGSSG